MLDYRSVQTAGKEIPTKNDLHKILIFEIHLPFWAISDYYVRIPGWLTLK